MNQNSLLHRRNFLKFIGQGAAAITLSPHLVSCVSVINSQASGLPFKPIAPCLCDDLVLADGFQYEVLIKFNDPINSKDFFGAHNDYIQFFPIDNSSTHGLLWVNHEYLHPVLFHHRKMDTPRTKDEIFKEQLSLGGSILEIKKNSSSWELIKNSKFNRRITGRTQIPFQKGYKIFDSQFAIGTVANCAGGKTPWNTVLTCEENYEMFYGNVSYYDKKRKFIEDNRLNWYNFFPFPPEHYGWIVEVNPWTGEAVKRNALGRFSHECATIGMSKDNRVVVYMGEDQKGGFLYKFISDSATSLEKGTLYAANTELGRWLPLDLKKNHKIKKYFNSQQDVLTYAHYAAEYAGATPQDRPEDIEIIPNTKSILVALTYNTDRGNFFGSLLKLSEKNDDFGSLDFEVQPLILGGEQTGFACPDNMAFDNQGNLWLTVDMAEQDIGSPKFKKFGNNGLFYIPMKGINAGKAFQVASAPVDAEFTGPHFSPDYKTLFLSVQHPGSSTEDPRAPKSTWPEREGRLAKSSVVTISGSALERLTSSL